MASSTLPPQLASQLPLLYTYLTSTTVGTVLSSTCFGIFSVQLYTYATAPATKNEPRWMHCFVALVAVLEIAHTIILWVFLIDLGRHSLLNPFYLALDSAPFNLALCLTGVTGAIVQSYYAYRVYRFSGRIWYSILPWAGSLVRAGITISGTTIAFVELNRRETFTIFNFTGEYNWVLQGTFSASVAVDVLNTVLLCVILAQHRTGMGVLIVDKLIAWTVETGMLTSCIAVALLAIVISKRYELLPGLLHLYPNMFSLTLLLSLNAREGLRRALHSKPMVSSFSIRSQGNAQSPRTRTLLTQMADPFSGEAPNLDTNSFIRLDKLPRDHAYGLQPQEYHKRESPELAAMAI